MSNDTPTRRATGKSSSGAPMGSTVSIVIAVIAVVVGFLVLKNINDGGSGSGSTATTSTSSTIDESTTTTSDPNATTTTAAPTLDKDPTQIVAVANASGISGAAGRYTESLKTEGWTMGTPTNGAQRLTTSMIYYLPGGENVAASIALAMSDATSTIAAGAMPTPAPLEGGATLEAGVTVLVMLAPDRADKPLPINAAVSATTLPTTPAGDTTTSAG